MVHVGSAAAPAGREAPERSPRSHPTVAAPRLSVVIVNYCQWENTAALVK
jgi:hypothetical protein